MELSATSDGVSSLSTVRNQSTDRAAILVGNLITKRCAESGGGEHRGQDQLSQACLTPSLTVSCSTGEICHQKPEWKTGERDISNSS